MNLEPIPGKTGHAAGNTLNWMLFRPVKTNEITAEALFCFLSKVRIPNKALTNHSTSFMSHALKEMHKELGMKAICSHRFKKFGQTNPSLFALLDILHK